MRPEWWGRLPFGGVGSWGRLVVALLAADILLAWMVLMGVVTYVNRVWYALAAHALPQAGLAEHAAQFDVLRTVQGLTWLATAAAFLAWVHCAYRNLAALEVPDAGYSPRWAVGAFLVPLLNLIHPLRVVRELWNASDPAGSGRTASRHGRTSAWLLAWWVVLLVGVAADPVTGRLVDGADRTLDLASGTRWVAIGALADLAAGVLGIVVVGRITRGQERRLGQRAERAGRGR